MPIIMLPPPRMTVFSDLRIESIVVRLPRFFFRRWYNSSGFISEHICIIVSPPDDDHRKSDKFKRPVLLLWIFLFLSAEMLCNPSFLTKMAEMHNWKARMQYIDAYAAWLQVFQLYVILVFIPVYVWLLCMFVFSFCTFFSLMLRCWRLK